MRSIIANSFKQSIRAVWKSKALFSLLVFIQILFLVSFFFISFNYWPKILDRMKSVSDYMADSQLSDVDLAKNILEQKDILGPDISSIGKNLGEIQHYYGIYLFLLFIICILYFSAAFSISYKILHKSSGYFFMNIFIASVLYLAVIFIFFYSILNISIANLASEPSKLLVKYIPFLILSAVLVYFMFISLSIVQKTRLSKTIQNTLYVGIKKAHYVLFAYFLSVFFIILFIWGIVYFTEKSTLLTLLIIISLLKSLALGKIFMISLFEKLSDN